MAADDSQPPQPTSPDNTDSDLSRIIDSMPEPSRSVILGRMTVERYSGNLLHPRIAREWDELWPGSAGRLLDLTEEQARHRLRWEDKSLSQGFVLQLVALASGFLTAIALIGVAAYCAAIDQPVIGTACVAVGAAGLVRALVTGRSARHPPEDPRAAPPRD